MSEPKAADERTRDDRRRWWVRLFKVPWLSLVLLALLAAVVFGPWVHWEPWVPYCTFDGIMGDWPGGFSPNGRRIITKNDEVIVWEIESGSKLFSLPIRGQIIQMIPSAAFSRDGRIIFTLHVEVHGPERTIQVTVCLWNAETGEKLATLLHTDENKCRSEDLRAFLSVDGSRIITSALVRSNDGTVCPSTRVWYARTGRELVTLEGRTWPESMSPDGSRMVTVTEDHNAQVRNVYDGKEVALLEGHEGRINTACFSPDGDRILTSSLDGTAREWDAKTGGQLRIFRGRSSVWAFYSPSGDLIVCEDEATARVRESKTGRLLCEVPSCSLTALSPDETRLVTTRAYNTVAIYDARTGHMLHELKGKALPAVDNNVRYAGFSPEGEHIAIVPFHTLPTVLFKYRRPEWWWGVFWLPEFWLAALLGAAFAWSAVRDVRRWRKSASRT